MNTLQPTAQAFWRRYLKSVGLRDSDDLLVTASIPGNKQIADSLVSLYLDGTKKAGSGLVLDYEKAGDPLPKVGNYWIILDSNEKPVCIVKTIRIEIHSFEDVPPEVARAEGEGDLSLDYWHESHKEFFTPFLAELEIEDLNTALIVTEFFEIVYREVR